MNLHEDLRNLVGSVISERYRVDELIGVGGMGAVFRGHHLGLKRDVAIKILHPDLTRDPELSARFDREAHSASRLDHPNCMQVTDFGSTESGMKFMVMQLLEGRELADELGQPLAPLDAAERMLQILRGLEHAHEQGIVHRDLKPENVFVTTDHDGASVLKLVDFGIAKIVAGDGSQDTMTQMGLIFGTPQYMSPEQATGMEIDARTDLYSAGVILYEMLAGRPPFEAEDPVALVRMQVSQEPPPLPDAVPEAFRAYVARMMAKQRDERFASAHEARLALEQIRNEQSLAEGVPLPHSAALSIAHSIAPSGGIPAPTSAARPLAAGAAAMVGVGLLAWALMAEGERSSQAAPTVAAPSPAQYEPITEPVQAAPDEVTADDLAAIDRLLYAEDKDGAEKLLQPLTDRFPDNAQLLWRQGKLQALSRSRRAQALASYGDAIERDPELLQNKDFYAELMDLMKDPKLRDDALNLALRKMGQDGHQFLLELVNRKKKALDFASRHRALEELASDPENLARVDMKLNVALDLWQAHDSLTPCKSYAAALAAIEAEPDTYFLNALNKAPLPEPIEGEGADPEDAKVCETLPARRDALIAQLDQMEAAAATGGDTAGNEGSQGGRRTSRGSKRRSKSKNKSTKKGNENCSFKQLIRGKCR